LSKPENQNCEAFLKFLAAPRHHGDPNRLAKYIDPAQLPNLIKLGPSTLLQDQTSDV
jgi:hypothetical protein